MGKNLLKKILSVFLVFAFVVAPLSACGKKDGGDATGGKSESTESVSDNKEKKDTDELIYGITSSPEGNFNPLFFNTQYDGNVVSLVYDSLLRLNSNIEIEPAMAEKYEMTEDGKKITFTLKDGLKFHDGQPLTSADVKFTLEALANKDYEGDLASYVESITGFEAFNKGEAKDLTGIATPDEKTVEISFDVPYSPVLINIGTLGIIPKHVWEKIDFANWAKSEKELANPIGSGPYKFEEFKQGEFVKLIANEDYYDGTPKLNKFTFKVVNEDTVTAELINGTVDLADISGVKADDETKLKDENVTVKRYPNSKIQYMGFNLRNDILKDINVRTAVAYGIDREAIVKGLLEGNGEVIDTPMVPTLWSYPKEGLVEYKKDVEKAKELLKSAGYEDTDNSGYVDKDGKDLELSLDVPTGDQIREQTGTIIQNDLKDIGIKVNLEPREFEAVMEKVVGNHDFELYLMGNTLDADPDPTPYWRSTQASDEPGVYGWNIAAFKNEEADKLMDLNRQQINVDERANTLKDFGKILNKELPWIPLYASDIVKAYNAGLKNYEPNTFVDFYNVQNWELVK
ncbi:ABC transporter substrate-binding protein [Lagierella sp.]|uniref:ABC transporter substrate-binding protein n=1 Tax=Lagierella sp. TaxID=2849657 RepID=UPI002619C064|nr:ABC transporter substrate-binding protein [Lagierella sp.]